MVNGTFMVKSTLPSRDPENETGGTLNSQWPPATGYDAPREGR